MKWKYQIRGIHTHVQVFYNGALCGTLVFRNEEFENLKEGVIVFSQSPIESFEEVK